MLDWTAGSGFVDKLVIDDYYAIAIKGFESALLFMELAKIECTTTGEALLIGWFGGAEIRVRESLVQHIHSIPYSEFSQL